MTMDRTGNLRCGNEVSSSVAAKDPSAPLLQALRSVAGVFQGEPGILEVYLLLENGSVACWDSDIGLLCSEVPEREGRAPPISTAMLQDVVELAGTVLGRFACARKKDGSVWCWGSNTQGAIGKGTVGGALLPVSRVAGIANATQIASGTDHVCALLATGEVSCWGSNDCGQLGDRVRQRGMPKLVPGVADAVQISVGRSQSCARKKNGTVVCWGQPTVHEGCDWGRRAPPRPEVRTVRSLSDAVNLNVSSNFACALRATGSLVCWGVSDVVEKTTTEMVHRPSPYPHSVTTVVRQQETEARAVNLEACDN